jgi:uncharacterized membrane protein YkoI
MKSKLFAFLAVAAVVLILLVVNTLIFMNGKEKEIAHVDEYNPTIIPSEFTSKISNPYFTFNPGVKYVHEGKTDEGTERIEVFLTDEKKTVMGIPMAVVWDRVWLNGNLIEDTKDWYAQDRHGNVWYFGEDSKEIVNGKIASTHGSWEAGIDGALPGIVMKASPVVGESYRQEYYKGEAEDMGEVVALGVGIKVEQGSFTNCLQTRDWTPLEPGADEYKYYCPEIGNVVYEVGIESQEAVQLIDIEKVSEKKQVKERPLEKLKKTITESEAISIAKSRVNGDVLDVAIEQELGKTVYVVEMDDDGEEVDVIIDIDTGAVLAIEN